MHGKALMYTTQSSFYSKTHRYRGKVWDTILLISALQEMQWVCFYILGIFCSMLFVTFSKHIKKKALWLIRYLLVLHAILQLPEASLLSPLESESQRGYKIPSFWAHGRLVLTRQRFPAPPVIPFSPLCYTEPRLHPHNGKDCNFSSWEPRGRKEEVVREVHFLCRIYWKNQSTD